MNLRKIILVGIAAILAFGLLAQLIPYGKNHTNPPIVAEPTWDSPETKAMYDRACADCHSNETVWPWYSNIAPVSWLVQLDTERGRRHLNTSEWGTGRFETNEIRGTVLEGEMPPFIYILTHPQAKLTKNEKEALIQGLTATFSQ